MKKHILTISLLLSTLVFGQVGVNTDTPNSTLSIEGSLEAAYKQITASSYTLTDTDYYVSYTGSSDATFILPTVGSGTSSFAGRIYKIKNISPHNITLQPTTGDELRNNTLVGVSSVIVPSGYFVEIVNNTNSTGAATWDISFVGSPNIVSPNSNVVNIYASQLRIPPHVNGGTPDWTNHTNTSFDYNNWYVISKESSSSQINIPGNQSASTINYPRMKLVYEYQGDSFDLTNLYPLFTAGNNSTWPDVFSVSFIKIETVSGKTRLTVSVCRDDSLGQWAGAFLLNFMLVNSTY
ncbi:MAG: hypothetical protein ACK5IC_10780 [Moheibacter sp.]